MGAGVNPGALEEKESTGLKAATGPWRTLPMVLGVANEAQGYDFVVKTFAITVLIQGRVRGDRTGKGAVAEKRVPHRGKCLSMISRKG